MKKSKAAKAGYAIAYIIELMMLISMWGAVIMQMLGIANMSVKHLLTVILAVLLCSARIGGGSRS